jgi:hypothetical protein
MAVREKRLLKPSPTTSQGQSSHTIMPSELVLVKSKHRVANSKKGGQAGPRSKRKASCKVASTAHN